MGDAILGAYEAGRAWSSRLEAADASQAFVLVSWTFLRLLALIYLAAFASMAAQITGLVGAEGILPASEYLDAAHREIGSRAYWEIPTLFWFDDSDTALKGACLAGMAVALAVFLNIFVRPGLFLCSGLYLSLVSVGQDFTSFQWDLFLLESGFLAIFLTYGSSIIVWLYRWLLFRFMFMGGVVKLASGDPNWWNLSALRYHFETQPLPSPLAWYAHQWPDHLLEAATAAVFVIELGVPFFVFLGRRLRLFAAASFVVLQGTIMLTGNYTFFNLLTIALCIFLLEDRDVRSFLGPRISERVTRQAGIPSRSVTITAGVLAVIILTACGGLLWLGNTHQPPLQPFYGLVRMLSGWGIVNGYGPFAVMTTERREIIIEGSRDGSAWLPYEFFYKPGDPAKSLSWNIPHQPRLDWQMWFAALGDPRRNAWLMRFMDRLREGSAPVLALVQHNPFPASPPRLIRTSIYRYSFAPPEARSATGEVWRRELLGYGQVLPESIP